jgi:DNA polymerase III delta prime subunit
MDVLVHHARLFRVADDQTIADIIARVATDEEVYTYTFTTMQIDDVRELTARAYRRPTEARQQLLIVVSERLTHEAQNALLKLLEEPPLTTRFCFIVRTHTSLLPTVLSRCQLTVVDTLQMSTTRDPLVVAFLSARPPVRLQQIAEANKQKDDLWFSTMQAFMLSRQAAQYIVSPAIEPLLRYLTMRGAAKKMIWEELALRLPVEG